MIYIQNLTKKFSGVVCANIPELSINKGDLIGLVGNNGAGKTTLFRLMLDLIKANSGSVSINNNQVQETEDWKNYTAAYLDDGFLIDYLSSNEYFYFVGKLHGLNKQEVDDQVSSYAYFFDGGVDFKRYIRDLSKGNQFKVGIVACLLQKPELLILDEPFANLDPSSQIRLIKILQELNANNRTTIIVSSHDLNHIAKLSNRILLMHKGEMMKDISVSTETLDELVDYFNV
ncbi:MAG: ATP-binding protein [Sphingobacteriia bacterium 28-36-52]|nr:MAG: ATP-binding protein [Sphingobacteriia bacterium 28-36-52]